MITEILRLFGYIPASEPFRKTMMLADELVAKERERSALATQCVGLLAALQESKQVAASRLEAIMDEKAENARLRALLADSAPVVGELAFEGGIEARG